MLSWEKYQIAKPLWHSQTNFSWDCVISTITVVKLQNSFRWELFQLLPNSPYTFYQRISETKRNINHHSICFSKTSFRGQWQNSEETQDLKSSCHSFHLLHFAALFQLRFVDCPISMQFLCSWTITQPILWDQMLSKTSTPQHSPPHRHGCT